ncbi:slit homolog 3 protein-like [Crassostrea angulata]|uniref:slit homolog 3 protein-like n=1 Tax=Magallana angulata TaxID=2784310 RepID=UPI0022B14E02|nr:slit homolog 3 protein-like [Crassostrea angulata]
MRGFQCLLLCVLLYSASVDAFGTCKDINDDASCPDNATCEDEDSDAKFECECKDGFDEIDVPGLTAGGTAVTVCVDLGVCSPLDNVDDCGNGQCVIIKDEHGIYKAICKCDEGYYGEKCDKLTTTTTTTTTTMPTTTTTGTTKRSGYGALFPFIGGGAFFIVILILLAGGAAALASSTG